MARSKGETKPERIAKAVAAAVQAGKEWHLESVDFGDPDRPKTCLEVDFPILPINLIAGPEMTSGAAKKPVYTWQKWWARRSSHVFRAMLISAATKAPDDAADSAKNVWESFYGNHQKNPAFRKLKVADIFMGGGTTVVEGARLGMQMYGNDLNPVAWFVVKNELAQVDPADVQKLLDEIEAEVKPQIMPFYACDCPRGHKGKWTHKSSKRVMGSDFDPLALTPEQRPEYEYDGPEVIYTFWSKHGPCQNAECGHRTPIMTSPVMAVKSLSVAVWRDRTCAQCEKTFDVEDQDARMAPSALFVCAPNEPPYTIRRTDGSFNCPHCGHVHKPAMGNSDKKDKKVELTLLLHPDWLKGAPSKAVDGVPFGGCVTDDAESTAYWNTERIKTLKLIEVRGPLPEEIECPDTKVTFRTDGKGGTVPKKSTFTCMEATCGKQWDVLESIRKTKKTGPVAVYAVQGYCPTCDSQGKPYSGRFFDTPKVRAYSQANKEWEQRRESDLAAFWPRSGVPYGFMTSLMNGGIPNHGYTHWWTMFSSLQLLIHAQMLKAISNHITSDEGEVALGIWQKYVQHECMMSFWDDKQDCLAPHFSNNNYHPKQSPVSNNPFTKLGRGNWQSSVTTYHEAEQWCSNPFDLVYAEPFSHLGVTSKTIKMPIGDGIANHGATLECHSSSSCASVADQQVDLVVTDPPFGGLLHYSELSDFYYAWLRLLLKQKYPDKFEPEYTPKALEAVANRARNPDDHDAFYQKVLTQCWREAARILKPAGILTFTFHHSEDEPWVAVLESLFDAGFYLEATYPIRSDETKGDGEFGSKKVEYDIIHVCRKRTEESTEVSWARLRRQIMQDVRQLQDILTKHQAAGLQEADMQVIRRGKALEYYSKHYGKVYVEKGREFTVREALLAINQLLDDQTDTTTEAPPVLAEPYTRQFFRLFADKTSLPRDQMQKYLRGTGVSPQEFIDRGWCIEEKKVFIPISPMEWAQSLRGIRRDAIGRDFDQVMFMVGACCEGSGIKLSDTLDNPHFKPHPATESLIDWMTRHGANPTIKNAARIALQLYRSWVAKNQKKVQVERTLFDILDEEA